MRYIGIILWSVVSSEVLLTTMPHDWQHVLYMLFLVIYRTPPYHFRSMPRPMYVGTKVILKPQRLSLTHKIGTRFPLLVQPRPGREAGFASNPKRLHLGFCGSCAHLHHVCLALSMSFVFLSNVLFLFFAKPCHGRLQNLRFVVP